VLETFVVERTWDPERLSAPARACCGKAAKGSRGGGGDWCVLRWGWVWGSVAGVGWLLRWWRPSVDWLCPLRKSFPGRMPLGLR
jgi:hypothetical protein